MATQTEHSDPRLEGIERRTLKVYQVLVGLISRKHYPPTIREILKTAKLSSTSVTKYHLERLRDRGLIDWEDGKARTLRVL